MLRKHKEAIGWTMADIKGLSSSTVQHRIHLIEEATPRRDPQCRLNPIMQEAIRIEILKLLDNGIIYSISDSQWVSQSTLCLRFYSGGKRKECVSANLTPHQDSSLH